MCHEFYIIKNQNNILVLAPHTDDGELGLGGSINYLTEQGKNLVYSSTAEKSVPEGFHRDILKNRS